MFQTGYSLIDKDKKEIEFWGNSLGISVSKPNLIITPTGLQVHDPKLNTNYGGYQLVLRNIDDTPSPSKWHVIESENINYDEVNNCIVVSYVYSDKPILTPETVTPLQFRKALRQLNLKTIFEDYISTLNEEAKEAWEYATEIKRNDPLIENAKTSLNKNDEEINDLFRLASTL